MLGLRLSRTLCTAVGIGASLNQAIACSLVHSRVGVRFLARLATVAFAVRYFFTRETRKQRKAGA